MMDTAYRFTEGARVSLRDGINPELYEGMSCLGNEGWIAARRKDKFDLPEVYIQWDKNHWTYNGAPDRWTVEDHFDLVEDSMTSKKDKAQELASAFAEGIASIFTEDSEEPSTSPKLRHLLTDTPDSGESENAKLEHEYKEAAEIAMEKIGDSEAFILIGVDREPHPQSPEGLLAPYALGYSKTDDGELLCAAQMAHFASKAHHNLALRVISDNA